MSIAEQPLSRRRSTVEDACGPPSALPSPPHSPSVMLAVPPTSAEKLALASSASTPTSAPAPASTSSLASSPVPPSRQKRSRAIFDEQPPDTCAADRHARRKEQNRRAQQAFRARKEGEVGGLRAYVTLHFAPFVINGVDIGIAQCRARMRSFDRYAPRGSSGTSC
jgi:hypothetical protein